MAKRNRRRRPDESYTIAARGEIDRGSRSVPITRDMTPEQARIAATVRSLDGQATQWLRNHDRTGRHRSRTRKPAHQQPRAVMSADDRPTVPVDTGLQVVAPGVLRRREQ